jgi:hypothetical protein
MPKHYTAKKVRRQHRKKRQTRKRQKGGQNIKQAKTEFRVNLVPTNYQNGQNRPPTIGARADNIEKLLDFYNKLGNDNEAGEIPLLYFPETGRTLRLKDVAKNIQYSTYIHSPNTLYEEAYFKVIFDVDIDSLWNNELFEYPKETAEEKIAFATELFRTIYYALEILTNEHGVLQYVDHNNSIIMDLDPIDFNNNQYIPNGLVDSDTFYPHLDDINVFFSPYIQV